MIIGILASALIPRLSLARERANDTARKAHIQNIASVLVAYQIDKGRYPATAGSIQSIENELVWAWLSSVPTDPDGTRTFVWIGTTSSSCSTSPAGQYMYTPVIKRWIANAWFVLMAGTQTEWWSNRVRQSTSAPQPPYTNDGCITNTSDFNLIDECQSLTQWANPSLGGGTCIYNTTQDNLRYIYKQ